MKWIGRRQSDNVEDNRRMSGGKMAIGGGAIGIIFIIIKLLMGGDSSEVLNQVSQQMQQQQQAGQSNYTPSAEEDALAQYAAVVLADNEDVWTQLFREAGSEYEVPKMVLFRSKTESACGGADAAMGPFYCPGDKKVYMDLAFFEELKSKFGAKGGDFAVAYVIAHEVGHHIQNILGTSGKVHRMQSQTTEKEANKLSVALELQADFYAGVWAHHNEKMKGVLEEGDIEEALSAAHAVGDDHLQKMSRGVVVPDAFTHGSSEQRMYWFKKGFNSGKMQDGTTFEELSN